MRGGKSCSLVELLPPFFPLSIVVFLKLSTNQFETMYTIVCFTTLYLTILGSDFAKNSKCYKNVKIKTHTTSHGKKIRILSLFNTGLTLFNRAFESLRYIRIPYSFILYDS